MHHVIRLRNKTYHMHPSVMIDSGMKNFFKGPLCLGSLDNVVEHFDSILKCRIQIKNISKKKN